MIKLKHILYESKNVGIIYHLMKPEGFKFNLENDKIGSGKDHFLSFTRNKNINTIKGNDKWSKYTFKFVIDGNKLSNKYKIVPIKDASVNTDESEEMIIGTINNIGQYIMEIHIIEKEFKNLTELEQKEILTLINKYKNKYTSINLKYI